MEDEMEKNCANSDCANTVTVDGCGSALYVSIDDSKHYVCSHDCRRKLEQDLGTKELPYADEFHFPMGGEAGVERDGSLVSIPKADYLSHQPT